MYDLSADNECQFDNLTIYQNNPDDLFREAEIFIGTYCGMHNPQSLMLKNNVMMIFQTDMSVQLKGFDIHYEIEGSVIDIDYKHIIQL